MTLTDNILLTPAQRRALDGLITALPSGNVFVVQCAAGMGRTTILQRLHASAGGALLGVREFMRSLAARQPAAIEEAFLDMVEQAIARHEVVIVDDLHLVAETVDECDYPRGRLLDAALTALLGEAAAWRRKLIFGLSGEAPWPVRRRAYSFEVGEFAARDFECICRQLLPRESADRLDYARIHRFAPALSAQQLHNACVWLARDEGVETAGFIEYLRSDDMASNVELEQVQRVDWKDLKGVDSVIRELEAKVALPFENDALSAELKLKPKRGVLLAGPPGTGKTTIGRALAHRLKSKFFLIDGTVIAGSGDFYDKVEKVFRAAKRNAPSVVFIDDADVIFEDGHHGFYRYLLTMLDGLESASAERVCVMMTAMNANSLPPAMVRSGRVELWLETRLPDADARESILRALVSGLPAPVCAADVSRLAAASRGLTGADLKNVVEDGKLLFAHDRAAAQPVRPVDEYFLEAIASVRANRRSYARGKPHRMTETVDIGFGG
jgi:ATP-dependent 26S proteasome regulatory subunit